MHMEVESDYDEKRRLRGPLAPLRLFLSSGRAVSKAGKWGLEKVRRRGRTGPVMGSVTAEHFNRESEQNLQDRWYENVRLLVA